MELAKNTPTNDHESGTVKTKTSKRKWREIEAIKDQYQLRKELSEMDMGFDLDLEHIR